MEEDEAEKKHNLHLEQTSQVRLRWISQALFAARHTSRVCRWHRRAQRPSDELDLKLVDSVVVGVATGSESLAVNTACCSIKP